MRTRSPFLGSQDGARFLVEFDHAPGNGLEIAGTARGEFAAAVPRLLATVVTADFRAVHGDLREESNR